MKWLKRAVYGLLAMLVVSIPTYWWLLVESREGDPANFDIDIAEVRRLADSKSGAKPRQIRVETVAHLAAPNTFVVAGDNWQTVDLPISSYELVYPDRTAVLDTAADVRIAASMTASHFDKAAYSRISEALSRAAFVLVTHEHPDHIGGLLANPALKKLLAVTRLTQEQVAEVKAKLKAAPFSELNLPSDILDGYRPVDNAQYQAVAPGVVLIKAPGHTPGSQMVYVQRADGVEFLFLGDVAWRMRNVRTMREKARLATWMAGEDRGMVRMELAALHQLHAAHPELLMVPGHDAETIDSLVKRGLFVKSF